MTLGLIVLFDSNAIMSLSTSVTGKKTNCLATLENFSHIFKSPFWHYNPAALLISNIFVIDGRPFLITSLERVTSGRLYFIVRYNFSIVFLFMNGQSLQAQVLLGGAGMNVLSGDFNCI